MKLKNLLVAGLIGVAPSLSSAIETQEYCDFAIYKNKGLEVELSPMGFNNKSVSRKRLGKTDVYPHFFYEYNDKKPVAEKSIVHRSAVILDEDFYRANEGSDENPLWVRYYKVFLNDCSKIYLRLDESKDEFLKYWHDRGGLKLSLDQFTDIHGTDIGVIKSSLVDRLESLSGGKITLNPLRNGFWIEKISESEFKEIEPNNKETYSIKTIIKRPFVFRGIKVSNITLELKDSKGDIRIVPGHLHGISKWSDHKGNDISPGINESVLISIKGIPDKVVLMPVFKTDSGKVIVEDEVLKERLNSGSGINRLEVRKGDKIGVMKKYKYYHNEHQYSEYLFDIDGEMIN